MCLSLALARENTLESTYLTLLHEIGHGMVGSLSKSGQTNKQKAKANHGPKWFKKTKELFKEYFNELDKEPTREPRQYHPFIPWKKVKQVERYKQNRQITSVFFDSDEKQPENDSLEVVAYDPKDYTDLNYAGIDRYNTRKTQKADKVKIERKIEQLQNDLIGRPEETDEMKRLQKRIHSIEAQLKVIENKDVKIMMQLASYIRDKVGSPDDIGSMISNICKLYSVKSSFKEDMKTIVGVEGETDWFEENTIRSFHNYMEALVSIQYISDNSDDNTLVARSAERLNGIPIALRYAMFLDGVHPDYLPKRTFEKLKKFGKTIDRKIVNEDFLFPKKNTRQVGLYNETDLQASALVSKEDFVDFHAKAESILNQTNILGIDSRDSKPRRRRKIQPITRRNIVLYKELPDFLSDTKNAIEQNMNTQPTSIPKQRAAECGLHAVNNLLGSEYTLENFQKVQGSKQWFTDTTLEIVLGNTAKLVNGAWEVDSVNLCFKYGIERFKRFPNHFMEDENLVGFVFFLGPNTAGHWTSMRKWSPTGFTYMDSYKASETGTGGFVKTMPKDEMIQYILSGAKYGRSNITSMLALYKDEESQQSAFNAINEMESNQDAVVIDIIDTTDTTTEDATEVQDTTTEDATEVQDTTTEDATEEDTEDATEVQDTTTEDATEEATEEDIKDEDAEYEDETDKEAVVDYIIELAPNREAILNLKGKSLLTVRKLLYSKAKKKLKLRVIEMMEENERFQKYSVSWWLKRIANYPLQKKKSVFKKLLKI